MIRTALALGATLAMTAAGPSAHADKPSPLGFRLVWVHQRQLSKLDADHALCTADAREREAEARRFMAKIDQGLERAEAERSNLPDRDKEHPDVVAAIAHMDALAKCREHIRASLAGELDAPAEEEGGDEGGAQADAEGDEGDASEHGGAAEEEGSDESDEEEAEAPILTEAADDAPATEEGFVASLSAEARAEMAALATFSASKAAALPASSRELKRIQSVAEVVWPLCSGPFAGLIFGGAPEGERAADADPWSWCQAAAQRVKRTRAMAEGMVARSVAALKAAEAKLSGMAGDARAEVEAAAKRVEDEAKAAKQDLDEAKLAAESDVANAVLALREETAEIELIGDLVGLEATAEVDAALGEARGAYRRYESMLNEVIDKLAKQASDVAREAAGKVGEEAKKLLRRSLQEVKKSVKKATRGK